MNDISELIKNKFESIISDSTIPNDISFKDNKVLTIKSMKKHYGIYFIKTKLMFRVFENNNRCYLEFRKEYRNCLTDNRQIIEQKDGWLRVGLENINELDKYSSDIQQIFEYEFNFIHGDVFHCCSQYVDCSNAKKCVHRDFVFSLSCYYRTNLLNNKIFYGANRNI